jgi:hypothetical protein
VSEENLGFLEESRLLGVYTFAERAPHLSGEQRMRQLREQIELADQVGLDVFGSASTIVPTIWSRHPP